MKKCEICQKPSTDLVKTLTTGPNGFRRYKACPGCRKDKAPAELDSDATYRKFAQAVGPSAKALSTQEKRAAIADLKQQKEKAPDEGGFYIVCDFCSNDVTIQQNDFVQAVEVLKMRGWVILRLGGWLHKCPNCQKKGWQ